MALKVPNISKVGNTTTVKNSAGGRLLNSVKAIFIGLAVAIISLIALTCNEGRNVKAIRAYDEVGKELIKNNTDTGSAKSNSENNGKLVAIMGSLTFSPVEDTAYKVTAQSFVLERNVEMYQWRETKKGSSTDSDVSYTYSEVWSSSPISSSGFYDKNYKNDPWPSGAEFQKYEVYADDAKLGDFRLTKGQLQGLSTDSYLDIPEGVSLPSGFSISSDRKYIQNGSSSSPKVGNIRISFMKSNVKNASMLGKQQGDAIITYETKNGTHINYISAGEKSGAVLVSELRTLNSFITWFLRIVLTILVCAGFTMLFSPVHVLVSFIPFLGKYIGKATTVVAQVIGGIIGTVLSLLVIAISWIAVRPLVAIPLLLISAGLIVLLVRYQKKKVANAPAPAPAANPQAAPANTQAAANGWTCECGRTGNLGKFCAECGKPKPAGIPQYKCDKCGWVPNDMKNIPKFCPSCGDPFDNGDIVS